MRPQDFKIQHFEKGKPFFQDSLLYIPRNLTKIEWQIPEGQPVVIEYCSGNGSWIVEKAKDEKEKTFIAVEKRFDRVRKILSKSFNHKLTNLFVIWGEAHAFTKLYVKDGSISEIYINFPDPWPKRRHEKNRLLNSLFVNELERVLTKEGSITVATDDEAYAKNSLQVFQEKFSASFEAILNYGTSFFEDLWREKGREIFYLLAKRHD